MQLWDVSFIISGHSGKLPPSLFRYLLPAVLIAHYQLKESFDNPQLMRSHARIDISNSLVVNWIYSHLSR